MPDTNDTPEPQVDGITSINTEEPVFLDSWAYEPNMFDNIDLSTSIISHEQPPQDNSPEFPFPVTSFSELIDQPPPPEGWNPTGHYDEPHLPQPGDFSHTVETMLCNEDNVVPPWQSTANSQDSLTSPELVGNPVAQDIISPVVDETDISVFLDENAFLDEDNLDLLLADPEPAYAPPPLPYGTLLSNPQSGLATASNQAAFDNSECPTKVRQKNKTKYRTIQPKPFPASEFTMTTELAPMVIQSGDERSALPPVSGSHDVAVQEQLATESHQKKQDKTENIHAISQVPNSYLCTFPVSSRIPRPQSAQELSVRPNLKRKRAKKGTKKCLRCFVSKKTVSHHISFLSSKLLCTRLIKNSVTAHSPVRIARTFGPEQQLVDHAIQSNWETALTQIFVS